MFFILIFLILLKGEAEAILTKAKAHADALRVLADAMNKPGGRDVLI